MSSRTTKRFRKLLSRLPQEVRNQARSAYARFAVNLEIAGRGIDACNRLIARLPDCQMWLVRVGYNSQLKPSTVRSASSPRTSEAGMVDSRPKKENSEVQRRVYQRSGRIS
jgi:hypothetical protein